MVIVGQKTSFKCYTSGAVVWSFNGSSLPDNVEMKEDSQKLVIPKATIHNTGMYICQMRDYPSIPSAEGQLIVLGKYSNE